MRTPALWRWLSPKYAGDNLITPSENTPDSLLWQCHNGGSTSFNVLCLCVNVSLKSLLPHFVFTGLCDESQMKHLVSSCERCWSIKSGVVLVLKALQDIRHMWGVCCHINCCYDYCPTVGVVGFRWAAPASNAPETQGGSGCRCWSDTWQLCPEWKRFTSFCLWMSWILSWYHGEIDDDKLFTDPVSNPISSEGFEDEDSPESIKYSGRARHLVNSNVRHRTISWSLEDSHVQSRHCKWRTSTQSAL